MSALTNVFGNMHIKTPPTADTNEPGTTETVLDDTDSIATVLDSPENNIEYENIIHNLQNDIQILKTKLKSYEYNYKDIPVPATVIADKSGNSLYTLCPLTTAHPKDAPLFNKSGQRIVGQKLFTSTKSKTRKRSHESPKTPSPKTPSPRKTQKTQKTPPSPGHNSKRRKH